MGFALGPILSAHRLDGHSEFVPVLRAALPFARIPLLLTAAALWCLGSGKVTLWAVVGGALVYGVDRRPEHRRLAATNRQDRGADRPPIAVRVAVPGLEPARPGAGSLVAFVLTRRRARTATRCSISSPSAGPSPPIIHQARGGAAGKPVPPAGRSLLQNLSDVPQLLGGDPRLRLYLLTSAW
jgi:hypothetical protein